MTNDVDDRTELSKGARLSLLIVFGISVLCAIAHAVWPDRVDQTVALFLLLAMVSIVLPRITKFKGGGVEFELQELKTNVAAVETAVGNLEKTVGPGSKAAIATPTASAVERTALAHGPVDPNDPNKGQFGGQPEANGRKLSAMIKPAAGAKSSRCRVQITVASTDPAKPLTGVVKIHLHPGLLNFQGFGQVGLVGDLKNCCASFAW